MSAKPRSFHIAVQALGGQGGGVLVDWIVDLAEHAGWTAQATSVAGVAQRTGATIYYIEMVEATPGKKPVLALMPVPGDVDVVIAAELMEAGRAVERGFVTPDRTTVVASNHRTYAIQEKMIPGNGVADSTAVLDVVRRAAQRLVTGDMQTLAASHGSVISASLFGALAGSGVLPFEQAEFEAVVERSGVGVKNSLAAMRAAAELARQNQTVSEVHSSMETDARPLPQRAASPLVQPLLDRIRAEFPQDAWPWLGEGLARVCDWQDLDYGREYLDRVAPFVRADDGRNRHQLTSEAARWIAVAMSYDDVIRVADLKTRAERSARLRAEVGAKATDVVGAEEYFHPRLEEAMGTMPSWLADWLDASPRLKAWLAPRLDQGRRIQSQSLRGHLQLRLVAAMRRWRRSTRRHAHEMAHMQAWLYKVEQALKSDAHMAVELLRCRRLIKGYSDTHARGSSRFDRLMAAAERLHGQSDAANKLEQLRTAALKDAEGRALSERMAQLGLA